MPVTYTDDGPDGFASRMYVTRRPRIRQRFCAHKRSAVCNCYRLRSGADREGEISRQSILDVRMMSVIACASCESWSVRGLWMLSSC